MGNFGGDINDVFEDDLDSNFLLENFENTTFNERDGNKSNNDNNLNVSALCCDEEINGYDKITGRTWIYPTNYPVRDYQFNIIKASILKNTLVSLPTGLGKTFIAAVIMFNFYRWYPLGKIVFTAPTRPLVAQQIEACYNIIAIPPKDTIEMTGHMQVKTRKAHWMLKRVFFATPQVIYNDIKSGICPGDLIRCLVIDEAHRALGNYAYCQIVSTLTEMGHKTYRLLALSATPGSKVEDVIAVVKNLHIAHLELRTENCIDVAPYSHSRKISSVIVPLGPELTKLQQQYVEILDEYARRLKQFSILPQNIGNLSKGRIVMMYKKFQCRERGARHPQHNHIMKDFSVLIALYHGLELLVKHGSRVFLNFFDEHPEKSWIQSDDRLTALLERLRDDLGVNPLSLNRMLPDGTVPEMPNDLRFGHPKFYKLKEIMIEHFHKAKLAGLDTKAIVFCEYRESVNLVHCLLLQCRPLILPQMFVGRGASGKDGKAAVSQKQQLRALRGFRAGDSNALVTTCVAEEGLDVGSVDLIVCFDISTRSPVRLVQRCGRTGRARGGQVFILVTEGREHQTLLDCMRQRDGLNKKILDSKEVENNLYQLNRRMVPRDFMPTCQKMYITVAQKPDPKEKAKKSAGKKKKGQKDLRKMLIGGPSTRSNAGDDEEGRLGTEGEVKEISPNGLSSGERETHEPKHLCSNKDSSQELAQLIESNNVAPGLTGPRSLQQTVSAGYSKDTEVVVDAKRVHLTPTTQNTDLKTLKTVTPVKNKMSKKKTKKSPNKKDGDIRSLFSASTKSNKNYTKSLKELGIEDGTDLPVTFINLFVDLNLENGNITRTCYICPNVFDCSLLKNIRKFAKKPKTLDFTEDLKLPDIKLLDFVDIDAFSEYNTSENETNQHKSNFDSNIQVNQDEEITIAHSSNDSDKIISRVSENKDDEVFTKENFDIGNIEDIFADSSPEKLEEMNERNVNKNADKNSSNPKETLAFFGLDSIEDIFADYNDDILDKACTETEKTEIIDNENRMSPILRPASPSILSGQQKIEMPKSPILTSQFHKNQSAMRTPLKDNSTPVDGKKQPKTSLATDTSVIGESNREVEVDTGVTPSYISRSDKSMFTVTQLVDMINSSDCDTSTTKSTNFIEDVVKPKDHDKNKRNSSPILLTQAEKRKISNGFVENKNKTACSNAYQNETLIILDSDSDENTQEYNIEADDLKSFTATNKKEIEESGLVSSTRKLNTEQNDTSSSPYFTKIQQSQDTLDKPLTLQEKVLAALTSNKINYTKLNNSNNIFCAVSIPSPASLKENFQNIPDKRKSSDDERDEQDLEMNSTQQLQRFRKDAQSSEVTKNRNDTDKSRLSTKRKLSFSGSDDDFMEQVDYFNNKSMLNTTSTTKTNHKARKKKRRKNDFLDEEAELSGDVKDSGDELSDDSIGSIIKFICDDSVAHSDRDMHAFYLKSVKSPVKAGTFKIPQLMPKYDKAEVLSQFDEEQDSYVMDSFCVGSQVGLTQTIEQTELEKTEKLLEEKRRRKKKNGFGRTEEIDSSKDSPIVRRKKRNVRRIESDSDDSG